jgi:hypothetical protein
MWVVSSETSHGVVGVAAEVGGSTAIWHARLGSTHLMSEADTGGRTRCRGEDGHTMVSGCTGPRHRALLPSTPWSVNLTAPSLNSSTLEALMFRCRKPRACRCSRPWATCRSTCSGPGQGTQAGFNQK